MNKTGFINKLMNEVNVDLNTATIINSVIEDYSFFGKKNRTKIVNALVERLDVTEDEAENYYSIASRIIKESIKYKIRHPFKSQD